MRDKQTFLMKGSFALLLFVLLGYMVKFYPETLVGLDQPIQTRFPKKSISIDSGYHYSLKKASTVFLLTFS